MIRETHLYQEIKEQPAAISRFLDQSFGQVDALAVAIRARGIDHIVIAARGTSDNAARYAKYVLGGINRLQVALATPSIFSIYDQPVRFGNALVLGISQSGQSPDIVAVLAEAKRQGRLTAAITNTPDSPLAQVADIVIELKAGPELAVAATKTYTNSLAAIAALSVALEQDGGRRAELQGLPAALESTLAVESDVAALAARYRYMQHCVVIGRVFNYATAFELALKLKELTYSIVELYSSADFQHGPFAILDHGFPVIVIAPRGKIGAEMGDFIDKVQARGAEVLVMTDQAELAERAKLHIEMPASVPEWLSPLTAIVPGQLLALYLANIQGHDVDAPRALNKVTETI